MALSLGSARDIAAGLLGVEDTLGFIRASASAYFAVRFELGLVYLGFRR